MSGTRWTQEQYEANERKRANERAAKNRSAGLPAAKPQQPEGQPLERPVPREKKSRRRPSQSASTEGRKRIRFTIFACQPCDWDGWHIKELQDLLVKAGILDDDKWNLLRGEIISEKVHTKPEERTEIEIL